MIYISLTTVPLRLKYWNLFKQNLESLLHQKTDKDYRVIVSIPFFYAMKNNEEYVIPDEMLEFAKNNPRLIINREEVDYGPILKTIGGVKYATNPDDYIIVLDDDYIYHEEMLEFHIKKLDEYPRHAICFTGDLGVDVRRWTDINGEKKYAYLGNSFYIPPLYPHYLLVPGHWHSVSYRRYYFKDDWNEHIWKLSTGDDMVMGYYLKKNRLFALCVAWDKETDWRPVNYLGRWAASFPIVSDILYPITEPTAGHLIRETFGGNHGREDKELTDLLHDKSEIFTENNNDNQI
jgi:hypothetical protein